ncbi:electron transporter SenC [Roseivivax halodurans JCM 10272]|uniref:Electron transporter SenC n=1 Tax=Roseivivax halodurans JCM 10272 TaxID=1449350 RepID=X7EK61_9RHOB|nr:SCO family protein [Roseivivax halodurans]ETX16270.1 electron transporter SenC [Roseivivax halodurans JCM 10272]
MSTLRKVAFAAWGVLAVLALSLGAWVYILEPRLNRSVADTLGQGDYELVTTDGGTFTEDTLEGAPSAVFFGFAHCPEVCPTTLGDIGVWQEMLAGEGKGPIRAFFVTVDPERDTPEMLGDYVSWAEGVTGVSGSREEIDKAISAFRIYARKVPLDEGGYTMDHSAMVLLFDEHGRFFQPVSYQEDPKKAVGKIRRLLAG